MFDKILIANRGEIACRVIVTARRLGVRTVAVYSDADAASRHVAMADEAVRLGPPPARESYLRGDLVIAAARATGAQADPSRLRLPVRKRSVRAGLRRGRSWCSSARRPKPIHAMGSKSEAKALMERRRCRWFPAITATRQEPDFFRRPGRPHRLPGADQGQCRRRRQGHAHRAQERRVRRLRSHPANAKRCASSATTQVLIEKYLTGRATSKFRCSPTRSDNCGLPVRARLLGATTPSESARGSACARHDGGRRAAMGEAAVAAAQAVGYVGAGTVEFIADQSGEFFFMEMNTRLQVEHPVTEMVTGLDLVEWQLNVAAGLPLPVKQSETRDCAGMRSKRASMPRIRTRVSCRRSDDSPISRSRRRSSFAAMPTTTAFMIRRRCGSMPASAPATRYRPTTTR